MAIPSGLLQHNLSKTLTITSCLIRRSVAAVQQWMTRHPHEMQAGSSVAKPIKADGQTSHRRRSRTSRWETVLHLLACVVRTSVPASGLVVPAALRTDL